MTKVTPKLIEELADRIHSKILAGEYPPGARLKQEILAGEFDVSRTPIREALSRLEAKGIVSQAQRRSAVVRTPSSREIEKASHRWLEMNGTFHRTIAESSNSRFLARTIQEVTSGYARSVMLSSAFGMNSFRIETTVMQHERILKALEARESARARRAMIEHVLEAGEFVFTSFANHGRE